MSSRSESMHNDWSLRHESPLRPESLLQGLLFCMQTFPSGAFYKTVESAKGSSHSKREEREIERESGEEELRGEEQREDHSPQLYAVTRDATYTLPAHSPPNALMFLRLLRSLWRSSSAWKSYGPSNLFESCKSRYLGQFRAGKGARVWRRGHATNVIFQGTSEGPCLWRPRSDSTAARHRDYHYS